MEQYGYKPYVLTTHSKGDLETPLSESDIIRVGKSSFCNKNFEQNIKLNTLQFVIFEFFDTFRLQFRSINKNSVSWYNEIRKEFFNNYICDKPDIIIGTYGPIGNIIVAKFLAKKFKVPWISELRDLISQYNDDIENGYRKSKYLDFLFERYLLSSSSAMITVTKGFKEILQKHYKKKIKVIYNGWEGLSNTNSLLKDSSSNYLYYAGSFYRHRLPGLFLLIDTLKEVNRIREVKLTIRSLGPEKFNKIILSYIKRKDMLDKVSFMGPCSNFNMRMEQQNAQINIVLSDINPNKPYLMSTIPGKLMELINVNKPILAISSKSSEMAHILKYTNKGIVTDSKNEIIDYILNGYLNYSGNQKAIYKFSRKQQTKRLCDFLDQFHI